MSTGGPSPAIGATIGRIARSGSANLAAAAVGSVAQLAIVVVVSRAWSPALAGSLFAATSLFLVALALVQAGVDQGFVRYYARLTALGRTAALRRLTRSGFRTVLGLGLLLGATGVALAPPVGALISAPAIADDAATMLRVLAVFLPVAACYELTLAITRGLGHMRPTIVIERICRPMGQIGLLLVVALAGGDGPALAVAWVLPYLLGFVAALLALRRVLPAPVPSTGDRYTEEVAEFWRFTAPRGIARFFQVGLQRADIAIVAALAGPAAGAVYTAATRFLVLGQVATQAIQQVSDPQVARLHALGDHRGLTAVFHQLTLWSVALTWPVYLVVAVFAAPLLGLLFGEDYSAGGTSAAILALAMLVAVITGPVDSVLLMAGRSVLSLVNTGTALVVDVVGCLLLVPVLGIEGAALAWAAAILVRNALGATQVYRHLHIAPSSRAAWALGAVAVTAFGAVPLLARELGEGQLVPVLAVAAGTLVYAGVLWRMADRLALVALVRRQPAAVVDQAS